MKSELISGLTGVGAVFCFIISGAHPLIFAGTLLAIVSFYTFVKN